MVLLGRILFSAIFLLSSFNHFSHDTMALAAKNGVPSADFVVPFSGVIEFCGALSILFGFRTKRGAWLIVFFLIPVTFMMHAFWKAADETEAQIQFAMFMKNISMLGGALLLTYFGAGPLSLDSKKINA